MRRRDGNMSWDNEDKNNEPESKAHKDADVNVDQAREFYRKRTWLKDMKLKKGDTYISVEFIPRDRTDPNCEYTLANYSAPINLHQSALSFITELEKTYLQYFQLAESFWRQRGEKSSKVVQLEPRYANTV